MITSKKMSKYEIQNHAADGTLTKEEIKSFTNIQQLNEHQVIYWASMHCTEDVVEALIDKGVNIDMISVGTFTPIIGAAAWGSWPVVKLLLNRGANVQHLDDNKRNVLHWAAKQGAPDDIIKSIIDAGVNPLDKSTEGKTAADLARANNHISCALFIEQFYAPTKSANFIA
jgi:ankyrin repeat protein